MTTINELRRVLEGFRRQIVLAHPDQYEWVRTALRDAGLGHVEVRSSEYVLSGKVFVIQEPQPPIRFNLNPLLAETNQNILDEMWKEAFQ